ncbi:MAG TPA: hypothetical protein VMV46_06705 [Thermoanaerobaculia bacterium]|nr:hypothetical protein [Thermoanaerobaculia bacterium]
MRWRRRAALLLLLGALASPVADAARAQGFLPGARSLLDAHNAYPYDERWSDRLQRALATGLPLAIEQDLVYGTDPATGEPYVVVAHETRLAGPAPSLVEHFFDAVRPLVERALADPDRQRWPLITLNLDVKGAADGGGDDAGLLRHLRDAILARHRDWLTTSARTEDGRPAPFEVGPILVLTGASDVQQQVFRDELGVGAQILAFGAARDAGVDAEGLPVPDHASDYRRWWNHPWRVVEPEGQRGAGDWTGADARRLAAMVERAHAAGLWIRFYTLNGAGDAVSRERGWFAGYDFGSREAVRRRWRACFEAGVDFVATDEYEGLAALRATLAP